MGTLKTLSVGDLHGITDWKKIDPDKYDLIVFGGDYTDSFNVSDTTILHNLKDLIAFQKGHPDKVVLLLGNHDLQYMFDRRTFGCSGYRASMYHVLHDLFNKERDIFHAAFGVTTEDFKYVWTHAGIHTGWYWDKFIPSIKGTPLVNAQIATQLNEAFANHNPTLFHIGPYRGGYDMVGGPFWVDKRMSSEKPLKGIHQIVGHTNIPDIQVVDHDLYTSITFIDCLQHTAKFYELTIYDA